MMKPDWDMGTSCYKSNKAANSRLKKKTLVLLMIFFDLFYGDCILSLTNIGENTLFVVT